MEFPNPNYTKSHTLSTCLRAALSNIERKLLSQLTHKNNCPKPHQPKAALTPSTLSPSANVMLTLLIPYSKKESIELMPWTIRSKLLSADSTARQQMRPRIFPRMYDAPVSISHTKLAFSSPKNNQSISFQMMEDTFDNTKVRHKFPRCHLHFRVSTGTGTPGSARICQDLPARYIQDTPAHACRTQQPPLSLTAVETDTGTVSVSNHKTSLKLTQLTSIQSRVHPKHQPVSYE